MDAAVVNAVSWQIAVEATRALPNLRLLETHPGGGLYDCLTLLDDGLRMDINREGSIHVLEGHRGEAMGLLDHGTWTQTAARPGGANAVAQQMFAAAGLPWPTRRPATTPRGLTYRVIARLLASRQFDIPAWDVRAQFLDSSGGLGSSISEPVPSAEMALLPANQVWRVRRGDATTAWLWEGWAWTATGERRDLMSAYGTGADIDALVAVITQRPTRRRALLLPLLPDLPPQPTGWE